MTDTAPIRPAAAIVVTRTGTAGPQVLMGQRGAGAAFMPSKFVFPGGAVDAGDAVVPLARDPLSETLQRLTAAPEGPSPRAICAAAIRELWEEAGLAFALPLPWSGPGSGPWQGFAERGLQPDAGALRFMFRAITPPGRPRRFDARFFLADAGALHGDAENFSAASDELSHLAWVPLDQARTLDLPFITSVVLAEVALLLRGHGQEGGVPFFDNSADRPCFRRIA